MSVDIEKSLIHHGPPKSHDCIKESVYLHNEKGEYEDVCRICGKKLWFNLYLKRK